MDYQEYRQSLNRKLAEKVQRELADFREEILSKSPQEVYDAAYQIILKSDIAECFSEADYSPQAAKALMKSPNLLQDIYEEWLEKDDSHILHWRLWLQPMPRSISRNSSRPYPVSSSFMPMNMA